MPKKCTKLACVSTKTAGQAAGKSGRQRNRGTALLWQLPVQVELGANLPTTDDAFRPGYKRYKIDFSTAPGPVLVVQEGPVAGTRRQGHQRFRPRPVPSFWVREKVCDSKAIPTPTTTLHAPGTFFGASVFLLLLQPSPLARNSALLLRRCCAGPKATPKGGPLLYVFLQVSDRPRLGRQASPQPTPCFLQPTPSTMPNRHFASTALDEDTPQRLLHVRGMWMRSCDRPNRPRRYKPLAPPTWLQIEPYHHHHQQSTTPYHSSSLLLNAFEVV